jgi:hypothetical protein
MSPESLKTSTLSIAIAGLLIVLTGLILYLLRERIGDYVRFFAPIPPLGVAAYIFVFNMYNHFGGKLPDGSWAAAKEIVLSTAVAAITFGIFSALIVGIISIVES